MSAAVSHKANPKAKGVATGLPELGQPWPGIEGSAYAGISTDKQGQLYALVYVATAPKQLTHAKQLKWAESLGADLPSRPECSLAFANIGDKLPKEWCWANELYGSSCAWGCYFSLGDVYGSNRSSEGAAVAVRRFPLESFNPLDGLKDRAAASSAQLRKAATDILSACDAADAAINTVQVPA